MFNENEIRRTIALMKPDGELFEVRAIYDDKRNNVSGYFRNADNLIEGLKRLPKENGNIYITLNQLDDACYGRSQKDKFQKFTTSSTSDGDVVVYDWLMIDLDPKRPKGTSSTDEQIAKAKKKGNDVYEFMSQVGFEKPLTALSGNGVHLLYKIQLRVNDENKALLKKVLETLSMLFDDEEIKIDTVNFNPSRVCKLYGTLAQKGSNTEERPHRMSGITGNATEIAITKKIYLEKITEFYPKVDEPKKYNNYSPKDFDLEEWLGRYSIRYKKASCSQGTKYILDCCAFDSNHKGKDAVLFHLNNGALAYKCFHNSCADKTWQDFRKLYEPEAYEQKQDWQDRRMYQNFNRYKQPKVAEIVAKEDMPVFYTAMDIFNMPKVEESFIKTGIKDIDRRLRGLKKGHVSLWSGLRASGKSSVISEVMLNALDVGNNVLAYSGELSEKNFMRWMLLQACGKARVEKGKYEGYYVVPYKYQEKISKWLGERLWLYNNDYGNDFEAILKELEKTIDEKKIDFVVLDNLMAFNISSLADTKWEAQTAFIWKLHELARQKDVHIAFVAHPRKSLGFLRLDDISGSADLANAVEDAFIVHRVNNDFKRLTAQMFGFKEDNEIYKATNVIEICKDRDGGTQDVFIPLWYEIETKRLKNEQTENIIYGWDSFESQIEGKINFPIEIDDTPPNFFEIDDESPFN